jgi:hypothetical protein
MSLIRKAKGLLLLLLLTACQAIMNNNSSCSLTANLQV